MQETHEEITRVKWQLKVREEEVRLRLPGRNCRCAFSLNVAAR
jgi:hypothetical protein